MLDFEGGYNLRDLGGCPTDAGAMTRPGCFVRGGNLDHVSAAGQRQILDYGVRTIIDLRDECEVRDYPTPFQASSAVRYLNLPLIGERLSSDAAWREQTGSLELPDLYAAYLQRCQSQIRAIVMAAAESAFATLFFCHAGKDRTGLVAALLLGAVGVTASAIVDDYARSAGHIAHLAREWRAYAAANGHDLERLERDIASRPDTMRHTLKHIDTQYGGAAGYLRACGVPQDALDTLRARFVG